MQWFVVALLLALPTLLITAFFFLWRERPSRFSRVAWPVCAVVWIAAIWLWVRYSQAQTDVDLIVEGLFAAAISVSAATATLATSILARKPR